MIEIQIHPSDIRRPSELRPTTPRAIERIVLRAVRPQPEDRYLSAAEMLEDLTSDAGTVSPGFPQNDRSRARSS